MQQPSEAWRSQVEFSSLDSNFSYDFDMPETDSQSSQDSPSSQDETGSQSSQEETGSQSSQEETGSQSSQMETDRHCSGMKDSPDIKTSQAIPVNVPVPVNTAVRSTTRRICTSLEDVMKHGEPYCKQLDDNMKSVKPFYFYRRRIGSETSTREFKEGLGEFKLNLRKYGSAFLNKEGGMLMIGVDDNGRVLGKNINFQEQDKYRKMAVLVFQNFKPPVWPPNYKLEFVPVERGVEEIPHVETPDFKDLMVLRISFERPAGCRKLYQTDQGKVYMRHDVTVQQMTPDHIHDWYDQKWSDEVKRLYKEIDELRRDKAMQLAKENYELKRVSMDLHTKKNSSPILQKRKMRTPASSEANKKSPRLGKNGCMAVPAMKNNEDNDNLKTWNEEENRKHRTRKQTSQSRHPLRSLASENTAMEEKSTSGNAGRLM